MLEFGEREIFCYSPIKYDQNITIARQYQAPACWTSATAKQLVWKNNMQTIKQLQTQKGPWQSSTWATHACKEEQALPTKDTNPSNAHRQKKRDKTTARMTSSGGKHQPQKTDNQSPHENKATNS
jgi:hypothetical protein